MHVMQKCWLHMKMRLITHLAGEYFEKTRILSCDCFTLKQYIVKANDLNFAKSLL